MPQGTVACSSPRRRHQSLSPIIQFIQFCLLSQGGPPTSRVPSRRLLPSGNPSVRPFSPSCIILPLLAAILAHLGAGHILSKMAQHSAKMGQHSLQEGPQIQTKPSQVMNSRCFFGFRSFWKDRAQDTKKSHRDSPKSAPSKLQVRYLGHILAPRWPT